MNRRVFTVGCCIWLPLVSGTFSGCKTNASESKGISTELATVGPLSHSAQYERYLNDTLQSLEMMRGKTALIKDSIWICHDQDANSLNFRDTEQLTSPTNIGLDLILLTQRIVGGNDNDRQVARSTIAKVLSTLSTVDYNHATGLFFRTYWPDTGRAEDINLSSVDNLHLAFGLWVSAERLKLLDPDSARTARTLFERMDLSGFYNDKTGLIGGNMRPIDEDPANGVKGNPQGPYIRDVFDYKYFGSEARSLYALGYALGLYRHASQQYPDFDSRILKVAIPNTLAEIATLDYSGDKLQVLRTWDGGGFQALLPAILVREDRYSPILGKLHKNYARRLLKDAATTGVPAAHSASAFGVLGLRMFRTGDPDFDSELPIYNGAAGHVDMVATMHNDVNIPSHRAYWDIVYTPHPAFMAATFARQPDLANEFADIFKANEAIASPSPCVCRQQNPSTVLKPAPSCECASSADLPNMLPDSSGLVVEPNLCSVAGSAKGAQSLATDRLYQPGLGWMDGYYVSTPLKGRVVPVLISLDQSMIALSLYSLLSADGDTVASQSVVENTVVHERLKQAYEQIDQKLAKLN